MLFRSLANGDQGLWVVTAGRPGEKLSGEAAATAARQLFSQNQQRDVVGYLAALRAKAKVKVDPALFE